MRAVPACVGHPRLRQAVAHRADRAGAGVLKIAVIGCGKIADSHIEQIRAIGCGDVVAVCDREPLMAEQLAQRWSVPGIHTDALAMLQSVRPDVVHIATPPDSHVLLATMALEHGCHVFVEKPFALTAADAAVILEAAARAGKRVSVNYLYNFESPALELQALLDEGRIGRVVHLESNYGYNLAGDYGVAVLSDPEHWVHRLPGKLFHNVLDHVLAKVAPHVGDEFSLQATAFRLRPDSGNPVLDAMSDELRFIVKGANGVTASGSVSAHAKPVAHTLRVFGTADSVELDYAARTLVRSARQTQPSAIGRLFPPFVQTRQYCRNGWRNVADFGRAKSHYFQCMRVLLARFYGAIEGRDEDPVAPAHVLRVCRMIDMIVEQTRRPA